MLVFVRCCELLLSDGLFALLVIIFLEVVDLSVLDLFFGGGTTFEFPGFTV